MEPTTPPAPISPLPPRRGWWSRNWKWFVPTGCLSLIVLFLVFIVSIAFIAFGALKSIEVYKGALQRAKASPAVTAALGSPITDGLFVSGHTNVNNSAGSADLAIPISGPKGKGTIYIVARKSAGVWNYQTLQVEVAQTKERIDLLQNATATGDQE